MIPHIPRATYRLQFHRGFTFADGAAVVPYLADLGISHLYASPILKARAGSSHCYDVVDPTRINPELGGEAGLRDLSAALRRHDMGLVVDIVPNHMGVGGDENPFWLDVLRQGPASPWAAMFDIDWEAGGGRLLAPVLGAPYGKVLAGADLKLVREEGAGWAVRYFQHLFPLRPADAAALEADPGAATGDAGEEAAGQMHALLERQHYRLAFWRAAADALNWRRFFDVTELAALNAEAPGVFEHTHGLVLDLYAEGLIDGLRVDHVDGLADPGAYVRRLRAALAARAAERPEGLRGPAYVVVEKILASGETLDPGWQADGTTGYDFMEDVSRLLHDADGRARLAAHWSARTGGPAVFAPEEEAARREILARAFAGQLEAAVEALAALAARDPGARDHARPALRRVLTELIAHLPRYRTYGAGGGETGADALARAVAGARGTILPGDAWHLAQLAAWLGPVPDRTEDGAERRTAVRRFEQLSAPVAAKAVEDTAFYRWGPLLSRNEVGSDAAMGGGTVAQWHQQALARARHWPAAMLASATHDHKRGEDVRARLSILSECPDLWTGRLDRWLGLLAGRAPRVKAGARIMLLQTLVGAWPQDGTGLAAFLPRVEAWQMKALREVKTATAWDAPDDAYEAEARDLARFILGAPEGAAIRDDLSAFVDVIAPAGVAKGLVATVLKLTAPGVPDIYQGTEFQDASLVDPDNRRPVAYAPRRAGLCRPARDADTRKQRLIHRLLELRARMPDVFAGEYRALAADGPVPMVAFARVGPARTLTVVCPIRTFGHVGADGGLAAEAWAGLRLDAPDGFAGREAMAGADESGEWPFRLWLADRA